jgi:vitamin B12/bleomycin/antimicrobial peptide transport system ATP-binding/permease protein
MTSTIVNESSGSTPAFAGQSPLRRLLGLLQRLRQAEPKLGRKIFAMIAAIFGVILVNTYGQVRLNQWQGAFYNALDRHDFPAFVTQLWVFFAIVGCLLVLVVAQTWMTETAKVHARHWLTSHLLAIWLEPRRAYLLGFAGDIARNPDQQISQDTSRLTDLSISFVIGLGQASLLLVSFIGVLWGLSSAVVFTYQGSSFTIPGYMVWCALAYSGTGSLLTWLVGRRLVPRNAERFAREGELRSQLVRIGENVEAISIERGEAGEKRKSERSLGQLLASLQNIANAHARLTWVTSGFGWTGLVFPIVVAIPGYFSGSMTLGSLIMVVGGFNQVQNALRWFIDNYTSIAEWQAVLGRVTALMDAIDQTGNPHVNASRIGFAAAQGDHIGFENLAVCLPGDFNSCILIDGPSVTIARGERIQFAGERGSGKTTLFMALAGLWPWGRGTIFTPQPFNALFVSERPYIPAGTLMQALAYPDPESSLAKDRAIQAMRDAGIGEFSNQLGVSNHWDRDLSLGDQQRLGIARLLLRAPDWAFLDNSLSALDDEAATGVLALIKQKLPDTGIIAMTDSENLKGFYSRVIRLGGPASLQPFTLVDGVAKLEPGAT